jgi:hypothetical protein
VLIPTEKGAVLSVSGVFGVPIEYLSLRGYFGAFGWDCQVC